MDTLFPGLSAMQNLHPVFVHFPVALLPLAFLAQALGVWKRRDDWQRPARWLLWLGTLAALAAAGTGLLAEESVDAPEAAWAALELHETLMLTTAGLAVALSLLALVGGRWLKEKLPAVLLVGLLILTGVLVVGADRGGLLVYQHGVGVHRSAPPGP